MRFAGMAWLIWSFALPAVAQQATPPSPQPASVTRDDLPPSAVLNGELTSFDRIRSDMANWSDVELAAFQATTSRAKADCQRLEQTAHEGEEALAMARLCSLGFDWDGTYSAARWYTRRSAPPAEAQHLATGFALLLKADLNLQATARALDDLKEMHERIPLSEDTNSIFEYTIAVLEVMRPDEALTAALLRQPALLEAVAGKNSSVPPGMAEAEGWHVLGMLRTAGRTGEEKAQKDLLEAAVQQRTQPLPVTDAYAAQRGRRRYEWLGQAIPRYAVVRDSYTAPAMRRPAASPVAAKATLLVVDSASAADAPALSLAVDSLRSRLPPGTRAKLVLTGAVPAAHDAHAPKLHAEFTEDALLEGLAADSGPLFVLADAAGRIQWMGVGTPTWMNPQQQAEVLLMRAVSGEKPAP